MYNFTCVFLAQNLAVFKLLELSQQESSKRHQQKKPIQESKMNAFKALTAFISNAGVRSNRRFELLMAHRKKLEQHTE